MANAILVAPADNVAVAVEPAAKGETLLVNTGERTFAVTAADDIPIYHKFALTDLEKGSSVIKYGEEIGVATADIPKGAHVHTHNVNSCSLL